MIASELRKKSVVDLNKELEALHRELFNLRMQRGTGQMPKANLFPTVRRNIARIKTILEEKSHDGTK